MGILGLGGLEYPPALSPPLRGRVWVGVGHYGSLVWQLA